MRIKGNEVADKARKEAIDMPGITTIKLLYINYYPAIRKAKNPIW